MSTEKDVSTLDFDGLEEVDDVKPQIIGDFSMLRKEYLVCFSTNDTFILFYPSH